jgi:hypothetical protein
MVDARIEFAHILRGFAASAVIVSHLGYLIWRRPEIIGALIAYPQVPEIIHGAHFVPITDFGVAYFWGHVGVAFFSSLAALSFPFRCRRCRAADLPSLESCASGPPTYLVFRWLLHALH